MGRRSKLAPVAINEADVIALLPPATAYLFGRQADFDFDHVPLACFVAVWQDGDGHWSLTWQTYSGRIAGSLYEGVATLAARKPVADPAAYLVTLGKRGYRLLHEPTPEPIAVAPEPVVEEAPVEAEPGPAPKKRGRRAKAVEAPATILPLPRRRAARTKKEAQA